MTLQAQVSLCAERKLKRAEVETFCAEQGILIATWTVTFAHIICSQFLHGSLAWDKASSALNYSWPGILSDAEITPFFWDIYLAFEDAETLEPESEQINFTKLRLQTILQLPNQKA